jgi:serine/threonine protein kinase/predicted Zn-dependent protease
MDVTAPHELADIVAGRPPGRPFPTSSVATVPRADADDDSGIRTPTLSFPDIGGEFEGFVIVGVLGHGSFGHVYLARQTEMANRLVALKITSEFFDETQTLAQLQHTNIVPIYSTHGDGSLRALCMPYFGATTLADVCRGLKSSQGLPTSGKHFVSTLEMRRASTQADQASEPRLSSNGSIHSRRSSPSWLPTVAVGPQPTFELLGRFTFVEAVLWLGARLADGLAHAHERGIIHRDIKPANVLLADDGRPMLLDFNLSADRHRLDAARGGTIPYMAPEQLQAQLDSRPAAIDSQADVYALGLVLYELLAGKPAYPSHKGNKPDVVRKMLNERQSAPPLLSAANAAVTPAIEVIIAKCLAFKAMERYPSARALQEDLELQLAHKPLRHVPEPSIRERASKWCRRHPRATSLTALSCIAATIVIALGFGLAQYRRQIDVQSAQLARKDAESALKAWLAETDQLRHELIRPPEGEFRTRTLAAATTALAKYGIPDHPEWQTRPSASMLSSDDGKQLRCRLTELITLLTQAELDRTDQPAAKERSAELMKLSDSAATTYTKGGQPGYWWTQRGQILALAGDVSGAAAAAEVAKKTKPNTSMDYYFSAVELYRAGKFTEAVGILSDLTRTDSKNFAAWFVLAACQSKLNRDDQAVMSLTMCIGLNPKSYVAYVNRGHARYRLQQEAALDDFRFAQDLGDTDPELDIQIAKCSIAMGQYDKAESICDALIAQEPWRLRAMLIRANARRKSGNIKGAIEDRVEALKLTPASAADFIARGTARLSAKDVPGAWEDFCQAEKLNPKSDSALMNQAHILSEQMKKNSDAIAVLDRLLDRSPESPSALASRAVLLARLGRVDEALRDAEHCLKISHLPVIRYQVAGVYALTPDRPGHVKKAFQLLSEAISEQGQLLLQLEDDPDLKLIHEREEFKRFAEAAKTLTKSLD